MHLYTVGGAIRDLLIGQAPRDSDVVFDGSAEDFIRSNPAARKAGHAFPVCLLRGIEYAPLRGNTLEADLFARDFTINAIAADPNGKLTAHPLAFEDIRNGVLRAASPSSLNEDPCRVFRAARFLALYPWLKPHPSLLESMRNAKHLLNTLAPERVAGDLCKALAAPIPGNFFRVLQKTGCLAAWFPLLAHAAKITAGPPPHHSETVLEHTCEVMDIVANFEYTSQQERQLAVWMACCHDLGKVFTSSDLLPHHYGHDKKGESAAKKLAMHLSLSTRFVRAGSVAARWHMQGGQYTALRPVKRVDMLMAVNKASLLRPFFSLVQADSNVDFTSIAQAELDVIIRVALPDKWRNLGPESGKRLRQMRGEALAKANMPYPL